MQRTVPRSAAILFLLAIGSPPAVEPFKLFGHGLSYTRFDYRGLELSSDRVPQGTFAFSTKWQIFDSIRQLLRFTDFGDQLEVADTRDSPPDVLVHQIANRHQSTPRSRSRATNRDGPASRRHRSTRSWRRSMSASISSL